MSRRKRRATLVLAIVLLAAGVALVVLGIRGQLLTPEPLPDPTPQPIIPPTASSVPTATEPILPPPPTATDAPPSEVVGETAVPTAPQPTTQSTSTPTVSRPASTSVAESPIPEPASETVLTPTPTDHPQQSVPTTMPSALYSLRHRMGVGGGGILVRQGLADQLQLGWYLDWRVDPNSYSSVDVEYMPMIRLKSGEPQPNGQALLAAVDALPGAVWLIGNEPDVKWQDNVAPDAYAEHYHDLYHLIKDRDRTSQVAIGGVSQPTPLRLRYLDKILDAYENRYGESMPVDVWNVHNFILHEERDSWGVDIPPGMTEDTGTPREITEHDDLRVFQLQIVDFRRWMKERGQQDKPLIVTEYGILMPSDYGFPEDRVKSFMLGSFEYFRTAADPALGYPADGNRLVQRWCWYSLADERYPTGNLYDVASGQLTTLGEAFGDYSLNVE